MTLRHLTKYRANRNIELGNVCGEYRKAFYYHVLPKKDADKNIVDKGYQKGILELMKCDQVKRHDGFANLNSSQAMALNLFGPLRIENILLRVIPFIKNQANGELFISQFEKKEKDSSEIDFYMEWGNKKVYFEVKYTEDTIATKSQSRHNDERWDFYYEESMKMILNEGLKLHAKDIFFNQYQLWRKIRMVSDSNSLVCFVFPRLRGDLVAEVEAAKQHLLPGFADRVKILYIEDVCDTILSVYLDSCKLKDHYTEFQEKYINGIG